MATSEKSQSSNAASHGDLHYSRLERFLLFMSKTDLHALGFCTPETRLTQASIGAMVAITVALAFFSAYFAINSSFFARADSAFAVSASILVAAVYALAIGAFDREVVSVNTKWAALPRFLLATLLGIVIAYPVELKLLEGRIDAQARGLVEERNAPKALAVQEMEKQIAAERERLLAPLKADLDSRQAQVNAALDEYNRERTRVACRERCAKRLEELAAARQDLQRADDQWRTRPAEIDREIERRHSRELASIAQIKAEVAEEKGKTHDFLSQFLALKALMEETPEVEWLVWFITAFFVVLELFPILIKLFLPHSEYNAYLDARRELNRSKIIHVTNFALDKFRDHPDSVLHSRDEVTDWFSGVMEDRNIDMHKQSGQGAAVPAART